MARPAKVIVERAVPRRDDRVEKPESGVYAKTLAAPATFAVHDAKNMLGVLTGNLAWMREAVARGANRKELDEALDDLETCVRRLTAIVREASRPAREVIDGVRPQLAPTNIGAVIQSVYQQVRRRAEASDVTMEVRILSDAEAMLDRGLVERVLVNLVDNALRFAPPRSKVRVTCDATDERVELAVHDEGPGIDKANTDRIFEPYFTTATGAFPGEPANAGLGLAFCRAVARAHGGDVRAEQSGNGACFVVELPFKVPSAR